MMARRRALMESLFRYEYQYDDRGNSIRREETISYDTGRSPSLRHRSPSHLRVERSSTSDGFDAVDR
jgi:hypothetical protein